VGSRACGDGSGCEFNNNKLRGKSDGKRAI